MEPNDIAWLNSAKDKLASFGFSAALRDEQVAARKGALAVKVVVIDELIHERNETVMIQMPREGDEPFAFGVHAVGPKLAVILDILGKTSETLLAGDPSSFAAMAKAANLTWFVMDSWDPALPA